METDDYFAIIAITSLFLIIAWGFLGLYLARYNPANVLDDVAPPHEPTYPKPPAPIGPPDLAPGQIVVLSPDDPSMVVLVVTKYEHPNWEQYLIVGPNDGGLAVALEMLGEDDDPRLLKATEMRMTQAEYEALGDFEG